MAVISGSRAGPVSFLQQHGACQLGPHGCAGAPCPSLHPSGGKYSSPPPCRQADTPVCVSHREFRKEKKKRFLPPTETISFSSSASVSTASGLRLSQQGGSQPALPPARSRPRAERWSEAAPKVAAARGHQHCSHLLWDTFVSCGIASSKTAAGQVAAAWDLGVSVDGSQGEHG